MLFSLHCPPLALIPLADSAGPLGQDILFPVSFLSHMSFMTSAQAGSLRAPLGTLHKPTQAGPVSPQLTLIPRPQAEPGDGQMSSQLVFHCSESSQSQNIAHNLLGQVIFLIPVAMTT